MITFPVSSVASRVAEARGNLVMYALVVELGINYYKVMCIDISRDVMKGARVYK